MQRWRECFSILARSAEGRGRTSGRLRRLSLSTLSCGLPAGHVAKDDVSDRASACLRTRVLVHATVLPPPLISVAPPASPERLRFEVGLFCYLLESCECVRRRTLRRPCMVCVECCLWCFVGCVWGEGGREQRLPPHHACQARPPPSAAAAQASWPICLSRKRSAFLNSTTSSSSRPSRAMKAGERREGPLAEVA